MNDAPVAETPKAETPKSELPKIEPQHTHVAAEFKHTSPLLACRIDPAGQHVYATSQDNLIQRWHIASGKATPMAAHETWVRSALCFHPSGSTLYSGDYAGRMIWWSTSSEQPEPQRNFQAHDGWVRAIAVSPDGTMLASCGNDRLVKLWSTVDGSQIGECFGHESHVYNLAFHPDGRTLVSGDLKGGIRHWDLATGEQLRTLDGSALWKYDQGFGADIGGVRSIAFSPDGKLLACGGLTEVSNAFAGIGNPLVVVFDFETGEKKQSFVSSGKVNAPVNGIKFHPEGFVIGALGGLHGGFLMFWKLEAPAEFHSLKLPDVGRDLDMHPDQMRLAIPHGDGTLRLWQMTAKAK